MSKIKFIYFDIGGVLLDFKSAFKGATDKFGIPFKNFIDIWIKYDDPLTRGLMTPQELWNNARKELLIKDGEDFDFLTSWVNDYKPIKSTHAILNKFIRKYKVGLLSNLYKGMIPLLREKKIIPDVDYSSIVTSSGTGLRKPELDIYKLATEKVNLKPDEIFFIDDKEDFIRGAKQIGWKTHLFNPNSIFSSFNELKKVIDKS